MGYGFCDNKMTAQTVYTTVLFGDDVLYGRK